MKIQINQIKVFLFFPLILLALIITGCATLQQFVQKPTISFDSIDFKNISLFEQTLLFNFKFANPNPIGGNVRSVAYSLKSKDRQVFKGVVDKGIYLGAGATETVQLPVTIKFLELFSTIKEFINADKFPYELKGTFGIGPFEIPYNKSGVITVPKIPAVSFPLLPSLSLDGWYLKHYRRLIIPHIIFRPVANLYTGFQYPLPGYCRHKPQIRSSESFGAPGHQFLQDLPFPVQIPRLHSRAILLESPVAQLQVLS